jgi:cobalt-zinc-cadmium efflux system outer membrane protein
VRRRSLRFAGVIAGGLIWAAASAQPPSPAATDAVAPATLARALDAAWQRAVEARAGEGEHRRAEAERDVAGRWWAAPPSWELSHRSDRAGSARREMELGLNWPLWLPGQRAATGAAASAGADRAQAAMAATRLQLAGQLREAAWALVEQQAASDEAQAHAEGLQRLAEDVERRVRAGDLARADALAARAETLAATAQQAEANQRMQSALSAWAALTGWSVAPRAEELAERPVPDPAAGSLPHPELRQAAAVAEHARRRLELVRASGRDAPEVTVGWRRETGGAAEPAQQSLMLGLRLPWGTADRQRPQEAAALADLDVATTAEQRLRERLAADRVVAQAAVATAQQQLDADIERSRLLRERATLIQRSFQAGESPLPELLRALAAAAQAEAGAARRRAALGLARARLQQAIGLLP